MSCPAPGALPFELDSWGWQSSQSAMLATNDPRNKDQSADVLGNPGGANASVFLDEGASVVTTPVAYLGAKARTTVTGGLFATPLKGENVSLWSYDGSAWAMHGRGTTDDLGNYTLDSTAFVTPNNKPLFSILEGDGSCAEHYNLLLPAGSNVVVTDIDGTLTTDDNQELMQIPDATYVPLVMANANTMLQAWDAKGYPIVYLTARPHVFRPESRQWLRDSMFPIGPLITAVQVEDAAAYKTMWLKRMVNDFGWHVVAAYGNAQTDIDAYNNVGIPKADTFIVGPLAGTDGTQPIANMDFSSHMSSFIAAQPTNH